MEQERDIATEAAPVEDTGAVTDAAPVEGAAPAPDVPVEPEVVDGEVEVEHDLEELLAKANERDEYLALAQRTQADFENFRKRKIAEVGKAEQRGIAKLAKELLPALDNLGFALAAAGKEGAEASHLAEGVKHIQTDLEGALSRAGIEGYSPEGERFDPNQHEAMARQAVEGAESGTVVEVYQRGYRINDFVLRPARVVVAE